MTNTSRNILLWSIAIVLSVGGAVLPRFLHLSRYFEGALFTAETYGTMVASFITAFAMGLADPERSFLWGVVMGTAPFAYGAFLMFWQGGEFNLLVFGLVMLASYLPPIVAASLGEAIRNR